MFDLNFNAMSVFVYANVALGVVVLVVWALIVTGKWR